AHRDPPCAQAVVQSGVRRVVISTSDPDPRMRGAGIEFLRSAGVETVVGVHEDRAWRLNEFYLKHRITGRPFVTAKFAMSLDGKIATRSGESRWISGTESRTHGHFLRSAHDAILVGVGTVVADDPELTARIGGSEPRQPLRVILDSQLRTPPSAKVVGPNTLIATTRTGEVGAAEILVLDQATGGRVGLGPLLDEFGRRGILSVLVEGGAEVHASFFAEALVDKVQACIAPIIIGGREAPGPVGGAGIQNLSDAIRLHEGGPAGIGGSRGVPGPGA